MHEIWNIPHEGQMYNQLSQVVDPEVYAWEHRWPHQVSSFAFADFQTRMELTRYRMRRLLAAVEQTPLSQNLYFFLPPLRATHAEFHTLLRSSGAWQDIHGDDMDLMSRAEAVLRKISTL